MFFWGISRTEDILTPWAPVGAKKSRWLCRQSVVLFWGVQFIYEQEGTVLASDSKLITLLVLVAASGSFQAGRMGCYLIRIFSESCWEGKGGKMDGRKLSHHELLSLVIIKTGNLIKISHLPISTVFAVSKVHLRLAEKIIKVSDWSAKWQPRPPDWLTVSYPWPLALARSSCQDICDFVASSRFKHNQSPNWWP